MNKKILSLSLRIIVSIALLVLLFSFVDTAALIENFRTARLPFLLLAAVFFAGHALSWGWRWNLLLRDAGVDVSILATTKTVLLGFAVQLFFPSVVGSDIGRVYDMARSREQKVAILSTVFMDRLIGLITIIGTATIAIAIVGSQFLDGSIIIPIVGAAGVMIVGWLIFFNKRFIKVLDWFLNFPLINRFADTIRELYDTIYGFQSKRKLFLGALLVSILSTVFELMAIISLSYALDAVVPLVYYFLFVPIIWVILVLPISIGGLGLREGVFVFFFTQVGMSNDDAATLSLLYYFLGVVAGIIGGVVPAINLIRDGFTQSDEKQKRKSKNEDDSAPQTVTEPDL